MERARQRGIPVTTHSGLTASTFNRLRQLVKTWQPNLINIHRGRDHLPAALLQRFVRIPIVVTRSDIRPFKRNLANRYLFAYHTDHVILSGRFQTRYPGTVGGMIAQDQQDVVSLGIDLPETIPELSDGPFTFVLIGRFDQVKGHLIVLAAWRMIEPEIGSRLLFVGHAARYNRQDLLGYAGPIGSVEIIDRPVDIDQVLADAHVGLITSVGSEAVVRSGLEYIRAGLPLIGTRVNAIPDLVQDGVNGMLVAPDDPISLAEAMVRMKSEYTHFRNGLLATRDEYSLERMVEKTLKIYRKVLS